MSHPDTDVPWLGSNGSRTVGTCSACSTTSCSAPTGPLVNTALNSLGLWLPSVKRTQRCPSPWGNKTPFDLGIAVTCGSGAALLPNDFPFFTYGCHNKTVISAEHLGAKGLKKWNTVNGSCWERIPGSGESPTCQFYC